MKKVFTRAADVIHLFAQRSQSEARSSNVFFYNDCLYSYGYHYKLAEFIKDKTGENEAVVINDSGYSSTTAKHISIARAALSHYRRFYATQTEAKQVLSQLQWLYKKLLKAKKPQMYLGQAIALFEAYNEFIEFTGQTDAYFHQQITEQFNLFSGNLEEAKQQHKQYLREQKEKEAIANAKKLASFHEYKTNHVSLEFDQLRPSLCGQFIETTQAVKIETNEANRFYNVLKREANIVGQKIAQYTVTRANGTIKIGCHTFEKSYLLEFGQREFER